MLLGIEAIVATLFEQIQYSVSYFTKCCHSLNNSGALMSVFRDPVFVLARILGDAAVIILLIAGRTDMCMPSGTRLVRKQAAAIGEQGNEFLVHEVVVTLGEEVIQRIGKVTEEHVHKITRGHPVTHIARLLQKIEIRFNLRQNLFRIKDIQHGTTYCGIRSRIPWRS